MDKIDFVNGTDPAINDDNLNEMQDNIEKAIEGTVLYNSSTGFNIDTLTATLSSSISNYDRFEAYFKRDNNVYSSGKIAVSNNNIAKCIDFGSTNLYLGRIQISGTTATWLSSIIVAIGGGTTSSTNLLYCTKIIGYKD